MSLFNEDIPISYHIVTYLEDVLKSYNTDTIIKARIPLNKMKEEDGFTPRICVAKSLEECVTAISILGIFRLCLSSNEDMTSYADKGLEVYPIIVLTFKEKLYKPTKEQVPDIDRTNEYWIMHDAKPIGAELK